MKILPILFNTEMVRAILDGRKTVTRRGIKLKYSNTHIEWKIDKYGKRLIELQNAVEGETYGRNPDGSTWRKLLAYRELEEPFTKGDILYVRETYMDYAGMNMYKADCDKYRLESLKFAGFAWRPSIHMPKEAARIWLKVIYVSVDRLQNMSIQDSLSEGVKLSLEGIIKKGEHPLKPFAQLWDSTIPKKDLDKYGWNANPWVWVIEFERCEKPKEGEE